MTTRRLHLALLSLVILLVVVSGLGGLGSDRSDPGSPELVELVPNGSHLWPYTSKARSFETRTLGINLIVRGDERRTHRYLRRHTEDDWRERPHPAESGNGTASVLPGDEPGIAWRTGHGSTRYTYVERSGPSGDGVWMAESYQLYDGSYLGSRYHIRAYESPAPGENWTAIQAHKEYWDWFRLRHTVTSISDAQRHLETDLIDEPAIGSLWRKNLGNGGTSDGDGWATVVEFATVVLASRPLRALSEGGKTSWERIRPVFESRTKARIAHQGLLVGGIVVVTVGVRVAGVTLEQSLPGVSPKVIAGVLYPVLIAGLPLCAGYAARRLQMENAFLLTVVAFAVALLLDFTYLDLAVLPIRIVGHRIALALSLGLIAAGASYHAHGGPRWNELVGIGGAGWVVGLLLPLFGVG